MPTMDEAMAKLQTAVDAHTAKAVAEALANQPAPIDPAAVSAEQEQTDAGRVETFANALNPTDQPEG
jgi:hypothetical protein